jgi:cytochrome c oxidase subunit 2
MTVGFCGCEALMAEWSAQKGRRATRIPLLRHKSLRREFGTASFLWSVTVLLVGSAFADAPTGVTNIFKPLSTPAQAIYEVSLLVLAICAGIFLVVAGLLTYTLLRFRQRPGDEGHEPPQVIVFVLFLATTRTIYDVQSAVPPADAINVTVIGHQWWWEIRYPKLGIVTANELHVPVSEPSQRRPTFLKLGSADVVHSFWVPQLAGKTDVIPNRENQMWIEPTQTGVYAGNCAEYCGMQHAHMMLRVIVHTPAEFEKWVTDQKQAPGNDPQGRSGRAVFLTTSCVNCHTIQGTTANGSFGPDLTHLMSRQTLGAGAIDNNQENLRAWVRDPQRVKPGVLMPYMQLTENDLNQVIGYLATLK